MAVKFSLLTKNAIRALQPLEKISEHGITATRLASGDVRFSINIMVDRQRIHRTIGKESEGVTREQAVRAIEALRTHAREDRLSLPKGRKVSITFRSAGEEYLRFIKNDLEFGRNYDRKLFHICNRLSPHFGDRPLDRISRNDVAAYVHQRIATGAAIATTNRELATLSHFFARACEWGWAAQKPKIKKGPEKAKAISILDPDEQRSLINAAAADQDPLTWLFVIIALATAMRHSEILVASVNVV